MSKAIKILLLQKGRGRLINQKLDLSSSFVGGLILVELKSDFNVQQIHHRLMRQSSSLGTALGAT
jgi:hypothetical protein